MRVALLTFFGTTMLPVEALGVYVFIHWATNFVTASKEKVLNLGISYSNIPVIIERQEALQGDRFHPP